MLHNFNDKNFFCFPGLDPPIISPFHFPKKIDSRQRVMVTCNVISGQPPFSLKWLKDGKDLDNSEYLSVKVLDEFTWKLTIFKLNSESIGNYSCRASNPSGTDEKYDMLVIQGMQNIFHFSVLEFL